MEGSLQRQGSSTYIENNHPCDLALVPAPILLLSGSCSYSCACSCSYCLSWSYFCSYSCIYPLLLLRLSYLLLHRLLLLLHLLLQLYPCFVSFSYPAPNVTPTPTPAPQEQLLLLLLILLYPTAIFAPAPAHTPVCIPMCKIRPNLKLQIVNQNSHSQS